MLFISQNMPALFQSAKIKVEAIDAAKVSELLKQGSFISQIEDPNLARVLSNYLSTVIPEQSERYVPRVEEDTIVLVQVLGKPLTDSDKIIPKDSAIQFSMISTASVREQKPFSFGVKKIVREWLMSE